MEHLSYPKHKIHFQVTNPLGSSKSLLVGINECTSMLTATELQELFQYVQTRDPSMDMTTSNAMFKVWFCELALRRYASFVQLVDVEEDREEEEEIKVEEAGEENEEELFAEVEEEEAQEEYDIDGNDGVRSRLVLQRPVVVVDQPVEEDTKVAEDAEIADDEAAAVVDTVKSKKEELAWSSVLDNDNGGGSSNGKQCA